MHAEQNIEQKHDDGNITCTCAALKLYAHTRQTRKAPVRSTQRNDSWYKCCAWRNVTNHAAHRLQRQHNIICNVLYLLRASASSIA